jgi:hypothetical protein
MRADGREQRAGNKEQTTDGREQKGEIKEQVNQIVLIKYSYTPE